MKTRIVSVVVVFVVAMLLGFVVHGVLLANDYAQLTSVMRPPDEAQQTFPWMILAHLLIAVGYTWIYVRGKEPKPWLGQGVRFGLAVAVLSVIPMYLIYHAVAQFPLSLALKQIVFDTIGCIVLGIVVARVNR
ncbi:MAG TPA: DUF1761 family protein [Candidatus Polarisedimenticolia bacterium]|nr:DUF1761 family protein [Candidatus Polarisedimenticolia bacterium]